MVQDILEKGKSFPIGTIHNGFKKIAEGKWRKVSEYGMTKEEHEKEEKKHTKDAETLRERSLRAKKSNESAGLFHQGTEKKEEARKHKDISSKLDSKEYSDAEVMGEENKNLPKGFEIKRGSLKDSGYGFKIGEMDINGETWRISFNENGSFDHATVFKNQDTRGREISLMNKKLRGLDINQDMFDSVKKDNVQKALITLEIDFLAGRIDQDTIEKARQDELEKGGNKTEFSSTERESLAEKKQAMPDGSFPIRNMQDLKDAIKSIGRAKDYEATKRWIIKRAKEMDATKLLPEDWEVRESKSTPEVKKALNVLELGHLLGRVDEDTIEKARKHEVGHVSVHKDGTKWRKTANGWESVKEESKKEGKSNIGEIRELNGKRYKKQPNGKWAEVSEMNWTKKQHLDTAEAKSGVLNYMKTEHRRYADNLSDKEYDDSEIDSNKKSALDQPDMSDKTKEKVFGKEYKKGDKVEYNGVTIHVGKDTSGGQDTTTYTAPSVSDKTFWDLNKLKGFIDSKGKKDKEEKFPTKEDIISKLVSVGNNSDDAKKMVEEHYDYIKRVYPSSGLKKLAEVIRTIY